MTTSVVTAHYQVSPATLTGEELLAAARRVIDKLPAGMRPWTNAGPGRLPADGVVEISVRVEGDPSGAYVRGLALIAAAVALADRERAGLSAAELVWSGAALVGDVVTASA